MSKNIEQVYQDNPITTNQATDLMYFGRAPYGLGDDVAMQFSDFADQFGASYTPSALTRTNDANVTMTLGGTPTTALLQPVSITLGWTGLLAISRGGTGVGSVTTVPAATAFAGWDTSSNLSANNFLEGTALVTNSGGTTTLTVASPGQQIFSGATFQTVEMPVVSTLTTGTSYRLVNDSSNAVFVISSGANAIVSMQPLTTAIITFNGVPGTTASSWSLEYTSNTIGVQSITGTANQVIASSSTGNVTLSLPQNIAPTSSPTFANLTLTNPLPVESGGTGLATYTTNGVLFASAATTIGKTTPVNSAVMVSNATGVPLFSSPLTNGQLIIGSTGSTPTAATLTAGANISIVNAAGSITISGTGLAGFEWNDVTGTSQNMLPNNGYFANNGALVTLNIPATSAVGDEIDVMGVGDGGWLIQCGVGQTIVLGSSTTSSAGSLASTNAKDSLYMICTVANTQWQVASAPQGNITIA